MKRSIDRAFKPVAEWIHGKKMEKFGIRNTMRLAKAYNGWQYGRYLDDRRRQFDHQFEELIRENGEPTGPINVIDDGVALDTSLSLPYIEDVLADADEVIAERGGVEPTDDRYRAFFRNIIEVKDLDRWPSFLNFITSSEVLTTVSRYLRYVPCLSKTLPTGVRFTESSMDSDALADEPPRDSQLWHIDPYDTPLMYVILLLRDVGPDQGPFCYMPEALSQSASMKLNYWSRGKGYRVSDEELYGVVDPAERRELTLPRGTVLFIDTSRCFHYGSRYARITRYQMMYGLVSPCRSDFSESFMDTFSYTTRDEDSRLRKMVLDKFYMG